MAKISKNQMVKLQKKYKTDAAIGKLFGVSRQAVHQLRQKYGIDMVADKNRERNRDIARMYKNGVNGTRLSRTFDLSISQVYRIVAGQN